MSYDASPISRELIVRIAEQLGYDAADVLRIDIIPAVVSVTIETTMDGATITYRHNVTAAP